MEKKNFKEVDRIISKLKEVTYSHLMTDPRF